jgi:hypothetical protein
MALAAPVLASTCEDASTAPAVNAALEQVEASVDPCGESASLIDVVRQFRQCAGSGYRVCQNLESERNFIEPGPRTAGFPTVITWNPDLRTELERGCGSQPTRTVRRDPVASLLHEVVHAVQDCHGLDPADHEFEAVRIENIYRRAHALCQRTRYGEERLPAAMVVSCAPGECQCNPVELPLGTAAKDSEAPPAANSRSSAAGDVAAVRTGSKAER